ncbi:MAG: DNA phosphorothioation-associated putative methyltransferase [Cyanobacteria bacterium SID2]|nr:DNA phosphorothioation-associated putative methyltransferase [Cyanobacteria bacterium SID2]MBP0006490.1 DNA phosphorothioation-associated putative methyltransferase [Cyanobacteria bacterium SBC]
MTETLPDYLHQLLPPALDAGILTAPPRSLDELLTQLPHDRIADCCIQSDFGKKLPAALYVHRQTLPVLALPLQLYEACARALVGDINGATLVKFSLEYPKLSYLSYPEFDSEPHPVLHSSIQVNLYHQTIDRRTYQIAENPPVLHRKETFVTPDYPGYDDFVRLTQQEERLGLLDNRRHIGTLSGWENCLLDAGVEIQNYTVVRRHDRHGTPVKPKIERHRAAIVRHDLSRPMKLALEAGFLKPETTFFDYGCGYGGDVDRMAQQNFISHGWDPYYAPNNPLHSADVVNLGYVINVIEDPAERRDALLKAWELTHEVLVVSAQVLVRDRNRDNGQLAYGDGIVTRRRTFQKYYEQEELKVYIESVLAVEAIPLGLGVYVVFRDEERAQMFRISRWRSNAATPRIRVSVQRFEEHREILEPLIQFFSDRGRLPKGEELADCGKILETFGTFRRAFRSILQATDESEWYEIAERRRQELLIYLALMKFGRVPGFGQLEETLQYDIRAFFGTYKHALAAADLMLFAVGDLERLSKLCNLSEIGQRSRRGLIVHISAFETLDPLLRIYEGCASRNFGRMEDTTLIQFHTQHPKISYLFCPDFDSDPHPAIRKIVQVNLQDARVSYYDYRSSKNPIILHKKEEFVSPEYPLFDRFARLTEQEEKWGLLDNLETIRRRQDWLKCLEGRCAHLKGHRVYWRKDADPYQIKLVRSQRRQKERLRQQEQ